MATGNAGWQSYERKRWMLSMMPERNKSKSTFDQRFIKEMLIKGILPVISSQKKKRSFAFGYKSNTYVFGLDVCPWAARKH